MSYNYDENTLVCSECGSEDVQALVWCDVSTGEINDSFTGKPKDMCWCKDCEKRVELITLAEYKRRKKQKK